MSQSSLTRTLSRTLALAVALGLVLAACGGAGEAERTTLVIYTSKENEEITEYIPVAQAAMPDVQLEVLRLSTGDLTARLLAEKDNPQADVIYGVAATSMMIFQQEGMLEPYAPVGVENILPQFRDSQDPPFWVGVDAYVTAFCVNTAMTDELGLPIPASWEDLLNPAYEGYIVMPSPASSGTGFMFVSSVLQGLGEEAGWDYLQQLDRNIAIYTTSGSRPCKLAGSGEFPIGISFEFVAARLIADGAPLVMVLPEDGSGYEVEANALVRGTDNPDAARRFLDWAISDEAMGMYASYFGVLARPGFPIPEGIPADIADRLFPMDFALSSSSRQAWLETWLSYFAAKVEPTATPAP
ncbi:MAG: extracellular solute-binding protein [Chloroflexota bacterium]